MPTPPMRSEFHGLAARAGEPPCGLLGDLPGRRLQHEHSMAVLRDEVLRLRRGTVAGRILWCIRADHPAATATRGPARS